MRMRKAIFILICIYSISCNLSESDNHSGSLKQWILKNEQRLNLTCDTIIGEIHKMNKPDSNWVSSSLVVTENAPNLLGALAAMVGDSTNCIVVELTFHKDPTIKKQIMIAAEDSSCLAKLKTITLKNDSTQNFIFGTKGQPLY